jgi:hypothetical protein
MPRAGYSVLIFQEIGIGTGSPIPIRGAVGLQRVGRLVLTASFGDSIFEFSGCGVTVRIKRSDACGDGGFRG